MSKLEQQDRANQRSEGGMFYPTGYIVAGFASPECARDALHHLQESGFAEDDITLVKAAQMAREAEHNLESPSLFASMGSSLQVRQKQLELARQGWDFLLIDAGSQERERRAVQALSGCKVGYAIKYKPLIIENIMPDVPGEKREPHPARVP
ncbi:hypothetical protein [Solimonas soli]|uniref:hypothetical protein n=1 Tax=Solimonas soli TaxID=413479 RepID=UPI0004BC65DB|nr:hypothetical protein [Solimonas soli]